MGIRDMTEAEGPAAKSPRQEGNGSGKSRSSNAKGKKPARQVLPKGLEGKRASTPAGKRMCFVFELNPCTSGVPEGDQCPRGLHVCANQGRYGPHPCTKRSK